MIDAINDFLDSMLAGRKVRESQKAVILLFFTKHSRRSPDPATARLEKQVGAVRLNPRLSKADLAGPSHPDGKG